VIPPTLLLSPSVTVTVAAIQRAVIMITFSFAVELQGFAVDDLQHTSLEPFEVSTRQSAPSNFALAVDFEIIHFK
jgi:hypothetical protein